ncbi:MAG: hypothetical protein V2I56_00110 [Desulfobacteraceae bacterium]|nr:hypothetical protein [Desulfobacteraceae bacterium]
MTAPSICQRIGYENDCPHKGSTSCRHVPTAGLQPRWWDSDPAKPHPVNGFGTGLSFDSQLRVHESMVRRQYGLILKSLPVKKGPRWFDRMLSQRIFPPINRIGLDEPISKGLFEIAPSSWSLMGPANDKIIAFHPKIHQEIEDVRQGLELKSGNRSGTFSRPTGSASTVISGNLNENLSPDRLFDLFNEIATPWIVLPRAFCFLEKHQCRYLPAYLTTIDRETRESFLMLFSRITVEFVGNFSLKFAARCRQPDEIARLLFYGYAALFWKTLRNPPQNLENGAAFDNFLNWLSRLALKNAYLGKPELRSIDRMKKMKKTAFPTITVNPSGQPVRIDGSRFMVTLRHGCLGMATVLRYFGIDQLRETRPLGNRFQCPPIQNDLHGLLHTIQTNYHLESKRTAETIKQFVGHLRSASASMQPYLQQTEGAFLNRRFNNIQILLNK